MKYIITENQNQKLFNMMYDYIEDLFPPGMGVSYFDDYDEVNFPENIKHIDSIAFYNEDYDRQMTIYLDNYFTPVTYEGIEKIKQSPILSIEGTGIVRELDGMFGKKNWHEPFLKWFYHNYGHELPDGIKIKTIE
jgi:hypothetical protein